jgi:hypothetical protein
MRGANLSEAFRRVTGRPWLLAALAVLNIGLTAVLSTPLSVMLQDLLDMRPAASVMVGSGDTGLLAELLTDHPDLIRVAAVSAGAGALLYGLLSWVLAGGVLAALALDGDRRARGAAEVLAESVRRAGRMVKIGLLGLPLRIVPGLIGLCAMLLMRAVVTGRTFQPMSIVVAATMVVAAVAWAAVSVVLDYARGLSLDDAQTWSWRLVVRGLKLAWTRRVATLQLIAFSMAAWLAVGLIYYWLGAQLPVLFVLTVLRLASVVARAAITATTLTAAARVARA